MLDDFKPQNSPHKRLVLYCSHSVYKLSQLIDSYSRRTPSHVGPANIYVNSASSSSQIAENDSKKTDTGTACKMPRHKASVREAEIRGGNALAACQRMT